MIVKVCMIHFAKDYKYSFILAQNPIDTEMFVDNNMMYKVTTKETEWLIYKIYYLADTENTTKIKHRKFNIGNKSLEGGRISKRVYGSIMPGFNNINYMRYE